MQKVFIGYLTIKEVRQENPMSERTFILKYPNHEVKHAFNRFLLGEYSQISECGFQISE